MKGKELLQPLLVICNADTKPEGRVESVVSCYCTQTEGNTYIGHVETIVVEKVGLPSWRLFTDVAFQSRVVLRERPKIVKQVGESLKHDGGG